MFLGIGTHGMTGLRVLDDFQGRPGAPDGRSRLPRTLEIILNPAPDPGPLGLVIGWLYVIRPWQHGEGDHVTAVCADDRRCHAERRRGVRGPIPPHEHPAERRAGHRGAVIVRARAFTGGLLNIYGGQVWE